MISMFYPIIQQRQRDALRRQGFTPEQISVLMAFHANYQTSRFECDTPTSQHLTFARWLYQHGKISG